MVTRYAAAVTAFGVTAWNPASHELRCRNAIAPFQQSSRDSKVKFEFAQD